MGHERPALQLPTTIVVTPEPWIALGLLPQDQISAVTGLTVSCSPEIYNGGYVEYLRWFALPILITLAWFAALELRSFQWWYMCSVSRLEKFNTYLKPTSLSRDLAVRNRRF